MRFHFIFIHFFNSPVLGVIWITFKILLWCILIILELDNHLLCSPEGGKWYGFGVTWSWVNDDRKCSLLPEPFPWHLNPTELISRSQNPLHCLSISLFLMHLLFIQPFSHRHTSYCQNTGANKAHSFPRWLCVTAWSGISLTFTPLRGTECPWRPAVSLLTLPNRVRPENCLDPAQPASCARGLARSVCSADILTFISEQ